jgi:hypothetical protein
MTGDPGVPLETQFEAAVAMFEASNRPASGKQ